MASNTIINRFQTTYNASKGDDHPNGLTRYFGGHNRTNHPFVSGYWQFIIDPPTELFGTHRETATTWFHSTAESFTPPTRTLNKADVPGQGGLGSSFVTGQALTRNFTVAFREFQNLPIMMLLELWTSIIDPYTGVAPVGGAKWIPTTYKGSAMAVLTKPTPATNDEIAAADVEQVYYFHGVWPESAPHDAFNSDISTNDVAQLSVTFSFDGWPLTKADAGVVDKAIGVLNANNYMKHTYDKYANDIDSLAVVKASTGTKA